ncbi:MAG: polyphosphate kinase 1 [Bacteroidota bacterium]
MDFSSFDIFKFFSESVATDAKKYNNREISWLAFNYRVLQEAKDLRNPLYERLKFLAIYSSNSDEFFRVRVASIRSLVRFKKKAKKKYDIDPDELLDQIHRTVKKQQEEYGSIFRNQLLKEMRAHGVFLITEKELRTSQHKYLQQYFKENILQHIKTTFLQKNRNDLFLQNRQLYLVVQLKLRDAVPAKIEYAIVELPTSQFPRFIELPKLDKKYFIIFLDDVIRKNLSFIFPAHEVIASYGIKLTRDAELYFEDELNGDFVEILRKAVKTRKTGAPSRFLFDATMPQEFQNVMKQALKLSEKEMIPGGRYHNFSDFFTFPNPEQRLPVYEPLPPLPVPALDMYPSMFAAMSEKDWLLHYPYHSYEPVLRLLEQAANDPAVNQIRITLYRIASQSRIISVLIDAANKGKQVTAFVELTARFDEESNIYWAEELRRAKVKVLFTIPKLKVHAKLLLISRTEGTVKRRYGYLSTGNFNEKTATVYCDYGLFTSDLRLTNEMFEAFQYLNKKTNTMKTRHLLVAPFTLRSTLTECIDQEIENAKNGLPASIILKVNSLEDRQMIQKLYNASEAGVKVSIVARGICCLVPGEKSFSRNISAISIVGRFLEHSRVYLFHNAGNEIMYLSSADWMMRNLNRRVEVAFPIYDETIKRTIRDILYLQLKDTVKARVIEKQLKNVYRKADDQKPFESQVEIYRYLKTKSSP